MMEIGRVCIKTAGRDSNKYCIVIDVVDDRFVMVDGQTRRKKANILHLEPTRLMADIKKNAGHDECIKALKSFGLETEEKRKRKKAAPK